MSDHETINVESVPECAAPAPEGLEDLDMVGQRLVARWDKDIKNINFLVFALTQSAIRNGSKWGANIMECRRHFVLRNNEIKRLREENRQLNATIARLRDKNRDYQTD